MSALTALLSSTSRIRADVEVEAARPHKLTLVKVSRSGDNDGNDYVCVLSFEATRFLR